MIWFNFKIIKIKQNKNQSCQKKFVSGSIYSSLHEKRILIAIVLLYTAKCQDNYFI